MITREALVNIAKFNGIGAYYQEKEYLQKLLLRQLYLETDKLVFKGGTCLKICYKHGRYSEDLDFDSKLPGRELEKVFLKALKGVGYAGIQHEFIKSEVFPNAYTCRLAFRGPLYNGSRASWNSIQIDAGDRGRVFRKPSFILVYSEYPDLDSFHVLAMQQEEILCEKLLALCERRTSRDLYDAWSMLATGVKLDAGLFAAKARERKVRISNPQLVSRKEFEDDLRASTAALPPYEQVVGEVEKALESVRAGK